MLLALFEFFPTIAGTHFAVSSLGFAPLICHLGNTIYLRAQNVSVPEIDIADYAAYISP